jgi:hypothetical protein
MTATVERLRLGEVEMDEGAGEPSTILARIDERFDRSDERAARLEEKFDEWFDRSEERSARAVEQNDERFAEVDRRFAEWWSGSTNVSSGPRRGPLNASSRPIASTKKPIGGLMASIASYNGPTIGSTPWSGC